MGNVIAALANKRSHVPYRDSILTYALQDSLAGNSKVLMFANIGSAEYNVDESAATLNFATRARKVEMGKVCHVLVHVHVHVPMRRCNSS